MSARRLPAAGCILIAGLSACVNLTEDEPAVTVWEGQFTPELAYPGVSGSAAAVSDPSGTAVGISIAGAEGGVEHAWGLRLGTCAVPDQQIGPDSDYPLMVVSPTGSAQAETHLGPRMSLANAYHVEVRASATDATRVACADLTPR